MNCSVNSENNSNNEIRRRRDTPIGSDCKSCDIFKSMDCMDSDCDCEPNYVYIDGYCFPNDCLPENVSSPDWECIHYKNINRHCYVFAMEMWKCVCDDGYSENANNGFECTITRSVWT